MISDKMPWVVPITNVDQLRLVNGAVCGDPPHQQAWFPTHMVVKGDEVTGYFSVCNTPLVHFWSHSQKNTPRDSMMMCQMAENLAAMAGHKVLVVPCGPSSPLFKLMPAMGYKLFGETAIFTKQL